VLLVLALLTTSWRVRVDENGLVVRGVMGWPVYRVPVSEIEKAGATEVYPGADFGGWGLRWAPNKRFGIITRGGPALEVVRQDAQVRALECSGIRLKSLLTNQTRPGACLQRRAEPGASEQRSPGGPRKGAVEERQEQGFEGRICGEISAHRTLRRGSSSP